jgi:hypothetical protein
MVRSANPMGIPRMRSAFKQKSISTGLVILVLTSSACTRAREAAAAKAGPQTFSCEEYARVLKTYVNEAGYVDYANLVKSRRDLDRFAARLAVLDPDSFRTWGESQQIAFWINAYNGLTLKAVVDHYPAKSIKDIGSLVTSVWDKLTFSVMGRALTLNQIEHEILRKEFTEPRIHMAINCASIGCPPLLNEPFNADTLEEQFARVTRAFLDAPEKFRIDRTGKQVHLSPILKWFGEDFVAEYASIHRRKKFSAKENAALNFVMAAVPEADRTYLRDGAFKLKWLDYDWNLNQQ